MVDILCFIIISNVTCVRVFCGGCVFGQQTKKEDRQNFYGPPKKVSYIVGPCLLLWIPWSLAIGGCPEEVSKRLVSVGYNPNIHHL